MSNIPGYITISAILALGYSWGGGYLWGGASEQQAEQVASNALSILKGIGNFFFVDPAKYEWSAIPFYNYYRETANWLYPESPFNKWINRLGQPGNQDFIAGQAYKVYSAFTGLGARGLYCVGETIQDAVKAVDAGIEKHLPVAHWIVHEQIAPLGTSAANLIGYEKPRPPLSLREKVWEGAGDLLSSAWGGIENITSGVLSYLPESLPERSTVTNALSAGKDVAMSTAGAIASHVKSWVTPLLGGEEPPPPLPPIPMLPPPPPPEPLSLFEMAKEGLSNAADSISTTAAEFLATETGATFFGQSITVGGLMVGLAAAMALGAGITYVRERYFK